MKEIPISKGQVALVDDEDFEWLNQWKWKANRASKKWRAMRSTRNGGIYMHRLILNAPSELVVDHINGNPLDNRRCNLRLCTRQENNRNVASHEGSTSRFKGVARYGERWKATIRLNSKQVHLGCFDTEEDAAQAYDAVARKHFGEFAWLNFGDDNQ